MPLVSAWPFIGIRRAEKRRRMEVLRDAGGVLDEPGAQPFAGNRVASAALRDA
jgi:hypothetical protein